MIMLRLVETFRYQFSPRDSDFFQNKKLEHNAPYNERAYREHALIEKAQRSFFRSYTCVLTAISQGSWSAEAHLNHDRRIVLCKCL